MSSWIFWGPVGNRGDSESDGVGGALPLFLVSMCGGFMEK